MSRPPLSSSDVIAAASNFDLLLIFFLPLGMKKKGKNDVGFWFDLILLKPQKTFRCDGVDDCGGGDDGDNNDDARINIILVALLRRRRRREFIIINFINDNNNDVFEKPSFCLK